MDIEEIRKKIAFEHDTLLGEDDPILMLATLQEEILRQSLDAMNAQQDAQEEKFKKNLVDALEVTVHRSQRIGENVVKLGAELIAKRAEEAFTEAINDGTRKLRKDWAFVKEDESWRRQTFIYGWCAGMCAIALPLALLKVWAVI